MESADNRMLGVLREVADERDFQIKVWENQDNYVPLYWLAILTEEVGEVAKAILEKRLDEYRGELIQVAAVAVAAVECLDG